MARFFVWSDAGDSLHLAQRLLREGHRVQFYVKDPNAKDVGRGIVPLAPGPSPAGEAIVIFDGTGHGAMGKALRARGLPVIGGNPFDDDLGVNRTKLMEQAGLAIPETHAFTSLPQAKAFLATHDGHWFFKPSGNLSHNDGTAKNLTRWLDWAKAHLPGLRTFELQKKVAGVEVSCEGWFDGDRFVPPFSATFETTKLLTGDQGPRVGGTADVVWALDGEGPPLARATVARLASRLRRERYVGPLALHCIVTDQGEPLGLAWSARIGQAWASLIEGDLGDQLAKFGRGTLDRFAMRDDYALTLRVTIPPYPSASKAEAAKVRGLPLDPKLLSPSTPFLPDDVMQLPAGPVCAGRDGSLGVVWAVGPDMAALRDEVLATAKRLVIPDAQFRTDPVLRAEKDWDTLADHGYLDAGKARKPRAAAAPEARKPAPREAPERAERAPGSRTKPAVREDDATTPAMDTSDATSLSPPTAENNP